MQANTSQITPERHDSPKVTFAATKADASFYNTLLFFFVKCGLIVTATKPENYIPLRSRKNKTTRTSRVTEKEIRRRKRNSSKHASFVEKRTSENS